MKLDVQVGGRSVAKLYRERDEYVLKYLPGVDPESLSVRTLFLQDSWTSFPWRHSLTFCRQVAVKISRLQSLLNEVPDRLLGGYQIPCCFGGYPIGRHQLLNAVRIASRYFQHVAHDVSSLIFRNAEGQACHF